MSLPDNPRDARSPRRARPRQSLKMQAIGFLSRREHSRQELRAKLLDTLRQRAQEDAALAAAAAASAEAARAQPSNGIDDAFAPRAREGASAPAPTTVPVRARLPESGPGRSSTGPSISRAALSAIGLADGRPLPAALQARLAAAVETGGAGDTEEAGAKEAGTDEAGVEDAGTARSARRASGHEATPAGGEAADEDVDTDLERTDPEAAVDRLLDWLAAHNYLNETRFVESRVNARARKQGTLRIKLELSRHGLALAPDQAAALRETEAARARELWQRKFGAVASEPRERARQARFLAARGFAADVVRRIVGGLDDD